MKQSIYDMLNTLVGIPSISSKNPVLDQSNRHVIDCLADWFEDLGFTIKIIPSKDLVGKYNLVANSGSGEKGLVFSGHSDTVPFDEKKWSSNPFALRQVDGRLYGLGVCDMKCFFPLIVDAVRQVSLPSLRKNLYVIATADEESTMSGIRTLYELGLPKAEYAVIGEPTLLKPVHMNKGVDMQGVRIIGIPGHSSNPARGKNAIDGTIKVIQSLMVWRDELIKLYPSPDFEVPYPTINFGRIFGGDSPNRICPSCEFHMDIRLVPGMDIEQTRADLTSRIHDAIDNDGFAFEIFPLCPGIPPMLTSEDSPLVKQAELLTGEKARTVLFTTEGYFYNALGMDTIIFGPGDINTAHKPDEYIETAMLEPAVNVYQSLIQHFCI